VPWRRSLGTLGDKSKDEKDEAFLPMPEGRSGLRESPSGHWNLEGEESADAGEIDLPGLNIQGASAAVKL
jgi:hypothetical protein